MLRQIFSEAPGWAPELRLRCTADTLIISDLSRHVQCLPEICACVAADHGIVSLRGCVSTHRPLQHRRRRRVLCEDEASACAGIETVDWVYVYSQLVSNELDEGERAAARPVVAVHDESGRLGHHHESRPPFEHRHDEAGGREAHRRHRRAPTS
eukprot:scaffold19129_cov37-Tisochrysis_lutea.AAC.3